MGFTALRRWLQSRTFWEKAALVVWAVILGFVSVRVFLMPEAKTVYPIFSSSGRFWWSSEELYEPFRPRTVQTGYRYSPTFAVLMAPFAAMPDNLGGVAWRLVSVGGLFGALFWLARGITPSPLPRGEGSKWGDPFAWLLLCCVPLSLQSVNNGQANVIVIAFMVAAVAAVREERWNLATLFITLAFVCKVYPLALGMLLCVLYPRQLIWRLPLGVVGSLLLPFACQHPSYVLDQYEKWWDLLKADDRSWIAIEQAYRDLWLLVRLYYPDLNRHEHGYIRQLYTLLQISTGAAIAVVCWLRQRAGWSPSELLISTLSLACAWMMLLGPATESSSFVLLAPALAWSVVDALQMPGQRVRQGLLWGSCALFIAAVFLGAFSNAVKVHALGVHSWATLLYAVYLIAEPRPVVAAVGLRIYVPESDAA